MLKKTRHIIPIYGSIVYIVLADTLDQFTNNKDLLDSFGDCFAVTSEFVDKSNDICFFVGFNIKHFRKIEVGTISHEAFHLTSMVCNKHGLIYDKDNEESFAYLIGHLSNIIHKFLVKNYDYERNSFYKS